MKLTEIHVDRFGTWENLTLPVSGDSINVYYGPNEVGKSTLMRFVRRMMYGFRDEDERLPGNRPGERICSGRVNLSHQGRAFRLERLSPSATGPALSVHPTPIKQTSDHVLETVLGGTSEQMFESVFAIGLQELQELATLDDDAILERIYGISLGPAGSRLLAGQRAAREEMKRLADREAKSGRLVEVGTALHRLDSQLRSIGDLSQKYSVLSKRLERLEIEIDERDRREQTLQENLRGYQFLKRVWKPWNRLQLLDREINRLPYVPDIDPLSLHRFDELEKRITEVRKDRKNQYDLYRKLKGRARELRGSGGLRSECCEIRRLAAQGEPIAETKLSLAERRRQVERDKTELDARMAELGKGWSLQLLDQVDVTPESQWRLHKTAQDYAQAEAELKQSVRKYKRTAASAGRHSKLVADTLKNLNGTDLDTARRDIRRRVDEVHDMIRLRNEEERLHNKLMALQHRAEAGDGGALPPLARVVLWVFGILGASLVIAGLYGLISETVEPLVSHVAWVVGAIYVLLGLCCGGVVWSLRRRLHPDGEIMTQVSAAMDATDELLRDTRADLHERRSRWINANPLRGLLEKELDSDATESDLLFHAYQEQVELDKIANIEYDDQSRRDRLSRMRGHLRLLQQRVTDTRREWCVALREAGLPETLDTEEGLMIFTSAQQARLLLQRWQSHRDSLNDDEQKITGFRHSVNGLAAQLKEEVPQDCEPFAVVTRWSDGLKREDQVYAEKSKVQKSVRAAAKEITKFDRNILDLRMQRLRLLASAGATNRSELVQRLDTVKKNEQLATEREAIQKQLEEASRSEPDLAVVEDDLKKFDQQENTRTIDAIELELAEIDEAQKHAYEEVGSVKQELEEMQHERSTVRLRAERTKLMRDWRDAQERWQAARLGAELIDQMRHRMEREGQPETLRRAAEYLEQLTVGRYNNIWAPLGERQLLIDDDNGHSLRVEELSSGTREQLFLAIRFALAEEMAEQGLELPLVLDDVIVNFDAERTQAAVDTLIEMADRGHQILFFTCHLHLAEIFEDLGVEPLWLPSGEEVPVRAAG